MGLVSPYGSFLPLAILAGVLTGVLAKGLAGETDDYWRYLTFYVAKFDRGLALLTILLTGSCFVDVSSSVLLFTSSDD